MIVVRVGSASHAWAHAKFTSRHFEILRFFGRSMYRNVPTVRLTERLPTIRSRFYRFLHSKVLKELFVDRHLS